MAATVSEVSWIVQLLGDLKVPISSPTLVFCDSTTAVHIASNPFFHERTKHIELDCHFVLDYVAKGKVKLMYIETHQQLADIFTKSLPCSSFLSKMGVGDILAPFEGEF